MIMMKSTTKAIQEISRPFCCHMTPRKDDQLSGSFAASLRLTS